MSGGRNDAKDRRRLRAEADQLIADDVARTATTARVGKTAVPPPTADLASTVRTIDGPTILGLPRWGCFLVGLLGLIALLVIASVLLSGGGPPPTSGQTTPPTTSASPTTEHGASPTATPTASPGAPETLADHAHALAPPDVTSVQTDGGSGPSFLYRVMSSRSVTELDSHYQEMLPTSGWSIGNTRRFDSRVIFEIAMADARLSGLVSLQPVTGGSTVEIQIALPPPDGGSGGLLRSPDDAGDVVTDSGASVDDREVDIVETSFQKVGDDYRVIVTLGAGLTLDWSFAVVVDIGSPEEAVTFLYEVHGTPPAMRIGQIDQRTGQIVAGEAEGVMVDYDRSTGTGTFLIPGDLLPDGTDRYRASAFHSPREGDERRRDQSEVIMIGFLICGGACR